MSLKVLIHYNIIILFFMILGTILTVITKHTYYYKLPYAVFLFSLLYHFILFINQPLGLNLNII